METKESVLELVNFNIIDTSCRYIPFPSSHNKDKSNQNQLPVIIDFEVKINREDRVFLIFLSTTINPKNDPGYFADVESVGVFRINQEINDNEEFGLIHFSGLQICIANVRSFIGNITSYYPAGRFLFHSIDLRDLVEKKVKIEKEKERKAVTDAKAEAEETGSNKPAPIEQAE
jgi:hypothetical protein